MVLPKRKNNSANEDDDLTSDQLFEGTSGDVEGNTRPKRKKEKEGSSNILENDSTKPPTPYPCRFCDKVFEKSQALGGHMNKHRAEKGEEEVKLAQELLEKKIGGSPWASHGRDGGGNLMLGQNPIGGTPAMSPYLYSNQLNQNQFQMNQYTLLQQQQMTHGLQGGLNFPQGNYSNSLDNNARALYGLPPQKDYSATGQLQAHNGPWVNSSDYPSQTGPSQQLHDMPSNNLTQNVNIAQFLHQFDQHQHQHRTIAPANPPAYQNFQVPQDFPLTQTTIDVDKSGHFVGSGSGQNQSPQYPNSNPLLDSAQAGIETSTDNVSDGCNLPTSQFHNKE